MAQPGTPSTTTASILGNTVPQWLDRVMLEWMRPTYRFYTFAAKRPLPTGEGKTVTWNRKVAFAPGYVLSEGSPISAVKTLSTNKVSALVEQIGDSVVVSDLARLASAVDTDSYATAVMADQAANTVELYILAQLVIDATVTHFVKKAGSVAEGQISTVVSAGSGQRLALSDIRVAATRLQSFDAPTYDGQNYIGIVSPKQMADLYADSGFTNWVDTILSPAIKRLIGKKLSKIREHPKKDNPELTQHGKSNDYELTTKILPYWNVIGRWLHRTNISEIGSIFLNTLREATRVSVMEISPA